MVFIFVLNKGGDLVVFIFLVRLFHNCSVISKPATGRNGFTTEAQNEAHNKIYGIDRMLLN